MGVLGWTEQQVLNAPIYAVVAALKGRNRLIRNVLEAIFGTDPNTTTKQEMTPELFRAMFG